MDEQEKLKQISSYTGKLLRDKFGRGPELCHATLHSCFLVLYIRGFISPIEKVLLESGEQDLVDRSRSVVMKNLLPELKGVVQTTLDVEVHDFYHDWNYPNNSGMIIAMLQTSTECLVDTVADSFDALVAEVNRISHIVQKVPEVTRAYRIAEHLYIVMRLGILVQIEKALVAKGYEDELVLAKNDLEKSYFHHEKSFEEIFQRPVEDVFVDWDLAEDNSLLLFVLKK